MVWSISSIKFNANILWNARWKLESFNQKKRQLLIYGWMNSDATMEHEIQRQRGNSLQLAVGRMARWRSSQGVLPGGGVGWAPLF
jgi:hypothetical protein